MAAPASPEDLLAASGTTPTVAAPETEPPIEDLRSVEALEAMLKASAATPLVEDEFTEADIDDDELLQILQDYLNTAREARQSGFSDRETNWRLNLEAYWSRYPAKDKADWQAQETLPEVQNGVDRFTATIRGAMMSTPTWYAIEDPLDKPGRLAQLVKKFVDLILDQSGTNVTGQRIGFSHAFGEAVKSGALMFMSIGVTWDPIGRRVVIDAIDPREIYLDPTGRGMFRVRQTEVDWHHLEELASLEDANGDPLYHTDRIAELTTSFDEEGRTDKANISGTDYTEGGVNRKPIKIHEYLCDIVDRDGELVAKNQLVVVAGERTIIRGPEKNPFWHGRDWIVCAPVIQVPFSVYGKSWVEGFRQLVQTFIEMTNLILDASFASSLKMFMVWIDALDDPAEATDWWPGKVFVAGEDWPPGQDFVKGVETGDIKPGTQAMWGSLQAMIRQATQQNELSLGQIPPKGDITATEIGAVEQAGTELARSIAKDIEDLVLSAVLELTWMTGLQHYDPIAEPELKEALGEDLSDMLVRQREAFRKRRFRFKASGITNALERNQRLRSFLSMIQQIGQNDLLAKAFLKRYSFDRILEIIMLDMGIDISKIEKTDLERTLEAKTADAAAAAGGTSVGAAGGGAGPSPASAAQPPGPPGAA